MTPIHDINYATGGLVPGWNVYVKPHLPQYWRSWWKDIYRSWRIKKLLFRARKFVRTKTPAPQVGHSRRRRLILPSDSTL
jgi:hypothetical protein